jgi:DNA-binding NarL/FixJ family response regulator
MTSSGQMTKTKPIAALIVDDEDDIRLLVRMVLQNAGDDLSVAGEAADGREALEIFANTDVDVVILDQRMPGLSGVETAREMLRMKPMTKIIMCSAYLDTDLKHEAESAGVAVAIAKREIDRLPQLLRELASE